MTELEARLHAAEVDLAKTKSDLAESERATSLHKQEVVQLKHDVSVKQCNTNTARAGNAVLQGQLRMKMNIVERASISIHTLANPLGQTARTLVDQIRQEATQETNMLFEP